MKSINVKDIEGLCDYCCEDIINYNSVKIDSRVVEERDIFVGIKGSKVNGNAFASDAINKKAVAVILDDVDSYKSLKSKKILVKDSVKALLSIGRKRLESYNGCKIAITGSSGKTTTKEMLHLLLSLKYNVFKTYGNNNNKLGLALNCCNIDTEAYGIFEFGTNAAGEITCLTKYLNPHICIITNIGSSHIGRFGNLEAIAEEKLSIIESNSTKEVWVPLEFYGQAKQLSKTNMVIKTFSRNKKADIYIKDLVLLENNIVYTVYYNNNLYRFTLNHFYEHLACDSLIPIGIAFESGLTYKDISERLEAFTPISGRGNIIRIGDCYIIDDTYNASFDAIVSAIDSFNKLPSNKLKIAVIGQMAEIEGFEEKLYKSIYEKACQCYNIKFVFVGQNYKGFSTKKNIGIVSNKLEVLNRLKDIEDAFILVKAARANFFEDVVYGLQKNLKVNNAL